MNGMRGKTALITGGSRGLGRNTALSLASRGADILFTYREKQGDAETLVAAIQSLGRRAVAFRLDTGRIGSFDEFTLQVQKTLQSWDRERFDYLINNAGAALHKPFAQTTEAEFDEVFNVHCKGVFFLTQKLLPLLNDGGRIVNVSSGLARFSMPGSSAYAAAKGAVEVMTRYLAKELGPRGITVNVVAPGAIETDFNMLREKPELKRLVSEMTALGRTGVADDIGPMIASLLSEENRWVNGQRIEASGGMFL